MGDTALAKQKFGVQHQLDVGIVFEQAYVLRVRTQAVHRVYKLFQQDSLVNLSFNTASSSPERFGRPGGPELECGPGEAVVVVGRGRRGLRRPRRCRRSWRRRRRGGAEAVDEGWRGGEGRGGRPGVQEVPPLRLKQLKVKDVCH